jgi:hypothetical protein
MNMASIPERFVMEAKNRPTGTVRVEDVLAAFTKAGVELYETRQHLAHPFDAMYCVGTKAGKDVHMSICEYKDEATATKGREMSDKAFKSVGRREIVQNKATTLTVRRGDVNPADGTLRDKLVEIFEKLPTPAPGEPLPSGAPSVASPVVPATAGK